MALKCFINGVAKNLTPVGQPPVTFINGEKKRLVKGVTFINGVKKVLWDIKQLQIDYFDLTTISGADTLYLTGGGTGFFANKNYLIYTSGYNVNKINVTNVASPTLTAKVAIGSVVGFSSVDSNATTAVYYARNQVESTETFNQLNVRLSDGDVTAANNSLSFNGRITVGCLAKLTDWINANDINNTERYIYVRTGATQLYRYQAVQTGGSLSGHWDGCPNFTKIDSSTLVGRLQIYGGTTGIGEFTTSGYTAKSGSLDYRDFLAVGDVIACAGVTGFGLYNRVVSGSYTSIGTATATADHLMRLVGKCRDYYYVVEFPTTSGGKFYLKVFDSSVNLIKTIELTGLSYSGSYNYPRFTPQLSQTGYLCFQGGDNKMVRIACY